MLIITICLCILLSIVYVLAAFRLRHNLRLLTLQHQPIENSQAETNALPSVSVCIPARNEDHAMAACLRSVIASTYPKLEIIVLDDASGDNTSALIKSFAHEGVRFIEGHDLPEGWLGKNHALAGLLEEASGSDVLFMDVDTRLQPQSIETIVRYSQTHSAEMVSIVPRRLDHPRGSVLFSSLRYFWEVLFHSDRFPGTASGAWLIHRETILHQFSGFETMKESIQPEATIAAALIKKGKYHFLIADDAIGLSYEKKWRSQLGTSVRLLYPLLGSHLLTALLAVCGLIIISTPLWLIILGVVNGSLGLVGVGIVYYAAFASMYASYLRVVWRHGWGIGAALWPFICLQEAGVLLASMIAYKRHRVYWKGRSIRTSPSH